MQERRALPHDDEVWNATFVPGDRRLITLTKGGVRAKFDLESGSIEGAEQRLIAPAYRAHPPSAPMGVTLLSGAERRNCCRSGALQTARG